MWDSCTQERHRACTWCWLDQSRYRTVILPKQILLRVSDKLSKILKTVITVRQITQKIWCYYCTIKSVQKYLFIIWGIFYIFVDLLRNSSLCKNCSCDDNNNAKNNRSFVDHAHNPDNKCWICFIELLRVLWVRKDKLSAIIKKRLLLYITKQETAVSGTYVICKKWCWWSFW